MIEYEDRSKHHYEQPQWTHTYGRNGVLRTAARRGCVYCGPRHEDGHTASLRDNFLATFGLPSFLSTSHATMQEHRAVRTSELLRIKASSPAGSGMEN